MSLIPLELPNILMIWGTGFSVYERNIQFFGEKSKTSLNFFLRFYLPYLCKKKSRQG